MVRQKSVVTYVEANGAFIYVWLQDIIESIEILHTSIANAVAGLQLESDPIRPGATLIGQASDQQFYRVRIIRPSFEFEGHHRCFFFDYGYFETLPIEKLFKLPSKLSLQVIPQQARCCMLDGIVAKTNDNWPDNVRASLSQRLVEREFLVEELGVCSSYPVIQLFEIKTGINVVDILANTGLGRRESAYGRWISYIPPNPKLHSGAKLVVQISEAESVTDFQVTVDPNIIGVDMKTILLATAQVPKQPLPLPISPHMLCLARIDSPVEGTSFFRAEVLNIDSKIGIQLRLMDVGKKVVLPLANLYTMVPDLLHLPFLALNMCLGGLELSANEHSGANQLEWLRSLACRRELVAVTILHTLSPNYYAVAFNEMGIINLSPLPYRLLPMLGQRPFDLFLKRSLAPCSFNDPVYPAVLNTSLPSYDTFMAAFLSHLGANSLTKLPPSAFRTGVFCIAFDESNEAAPYPLRCVILTPIMGSNQMRCMLYEIDTGRQTVRSLENIYCAPAWAFAHPAFCVPVVAFDAQGKPSVPRPAPTQVRAIHREPVATPAGILVVQEIVIAPATYETTRALPVIEEVIIDDWDADTASETASSAPEDVQHASVDLDQMIPQESIISSIPENLPADVKDEPILCDESSLESSPEQQVFGENGSRFEEQVHDSSTDVNVEEIGESKSLADERQVESSKIEAESEHLDHHVPSDGADASQQAENGEYYHTEDADFEEKMENKLNMDIEESNCDEIEPPMEADNDRNPEMSDMDDKRLDVRTENSPVVLDTWSQDQGDKMIGPVDENQDQMTEPASSEPVEKSQEQEDLNTKSEPVESNIEAIIEAQYQSEAEKSPIHETEITEIVPTEEPCEEHRGSIGSIGEEHEVAQAELVEGSPVDQPSPAFEDGLEAQQECEELQSEPVEITTVSVEQLSEKVETPGQHDSEGIDSCPLAELPEISVKGVSVETNEESGCQVNQESPKEAEGSAITLVETPIAKAEETEPADNISEEEPVGEAASEGCVDGMGDESQPKESPIQETTQQEAIEMKEAAPDEEAAVELSEELPVSGVSEESMKIELGEKCECEMAKEEVQPNLEIEQKLAFDENKLVYQNENNLQTGDQGEAKPSENQLVEIPLGDGDNSVEEFSEPRFLEQGIEEDIFDVPLDAVEHEKPAHDDSAPVFSIVVEAPAEEGNTDDLHEDDIFDDGTTEMTEVVDDVEVTIEATEEHENENGCLTVDDRSAFEKQHSVPSRLLSDNAIANQLLSPSCPFTILVTPPTRNNSIDPSAISSEGETLLPVTLLENVAEIVETGIPISNDSEDKELSDTPPPSFSSESIAASSECAFYTYPKTLPLGSNFVTISHVPDDVIASKQFWVRLADEYDTVKSEYISNTLSEIGFRLSLVEEEIGDILPGYCCIAPGELSGKLLRAEVIEFVNPDKSMAKVLYVDYGRTEVSRVSRFRVCPRELLTVPRLAYLCVATNTLVETLGCLHCDERRQIEVVSCDDTTHIHKVEVPLLSVDALPQMQLGERVDAEYSYEIAHVDAPSQFYVKLLSPGGDEESAKEYDQMNRLLQDENALPRELSSEWKESDLTNRLVVVRSDGDSWKRAVVLACQTDQFKGEKFLLVQLIDSGVTETAGFDKIMPFSCQRPFDLPPQLACVHIINHEEMSIPVTPEIAGQTITLKVVDARFEGHTMQLNAECCDPRFLKTPAEIIQRGLPAYSLDLTGSTQNVEVTHFDSLHDDFFVQLVSDLPRVEEIEELLNLLNDTADGSNNALRQVDKTEIGQICASLFPEDPSSGESMLYRCEVISLDPLTVFYVDYGNTEEVTRLLEMPVDESLLWGPPLTHRCRLLQTSSTLVEQPERVEELLQEPDVHVSLLFNERFIYEKPISYTCEVILPPPDDELPESGLPDYPVLIDGIYSPTHLSEDGAIWLQSEDLGLNLIQLETDLQTLCEENAASLVPLSSFSVGKGCIVSSRTSGDYSVYRGEITHVETASISVLRIDYGQEETFEMSEIQANRVALYSISKHRRILEVPRLAVPCKLLDDTDAYRRLRLSDFPHVSYMVNFARTITGSVAPPFFVDLRALDDRSSTTTPGYRGPLSAARPTAFTFPSPIVEHQTKSFGGQMQRSISNVSESGFGDNVFEEPTSPSESPALKSVNNLFKPAFTDGTRFRAICVYLASAEASGTENSDVAFFHDENRSAELERLYDALSDISRLPPVNFPDLSVGSMVAARYSVDNFWYRGIVLSKPRNRDSGLTVFFIDYGNCEKIPSCTQADIRQLPPSLSPDRIKPLAIAVRPYFNPHAPSMPVRFQLDEAYVLEVVSSDTYLTGLFAIPSSQIPVLVVNIAGSLTTPQPSVSQQQKPVVQPKQEPQEQKVASLPLLQPKLEPQVIPTTVKNVMASFSKPLTAQPKLEIKTEPVFTSGIRYSSVTLRKLKQTAAASSLNLTNLENIISLGILRITMTISEHFQHDSRLLLPSVTNVVSSVAKSTNSTSGGAFSVRPFTIAQLPKTCSAKPFDAKVVWIADDVMFVQLETDESLEKLDLVDDLAQRCGSVGIKVNGNESPYSLLNKGFLAKWTAGDGRWYRAVVRNVADVTSKPPTVETFFVDFGNTDLVPITDLVQLPDQTSNPDQYQLLTVPILSLPISKGSYNVKTDDSVKVCLEWRPVSVPPYSLKSLEIIQ